MVRAAHGALHVRRGAPVRRRRFTINDDAELVIGGGSGPNFDGLGRYSVADSATWAQTAISGVRLFVKDVDSLALWAVERVTGRTRILCTTN